LDLSWLKQVIHLDPLSSLQALKTLNLGGCEQVSDLSPLSSLQSLKTLELSDCRNLINLGPLSSLTQLNTLDLALCNQVSDLSPLSSLQGLKTLNLRRCEQVSDLSPLSSLTQLNTLDLSICNQVSNLSPLSSLQSLKTLELSDCRNLINLGPLSSLQGLKTLNLSGCRNLIDISPLSFLQELKTLNLALCSNLIDLGPLSSLQGLKTLDLSSCKKIVLIKSLQSLQNLTALELYDTPNIRDIQLLTGCRQLKDLTWIDAVACSEVLIQCACNRDDKMYIINNLDQWITEIELSKDANNFAIKLFTALRILDVDWKYAYLPTVAAQLRVRGLQRETANDINVLTWETWCSLATDLPLEQSLEILESAIFDPDIIRETEVLLSPVVVAYADLAEIHPADRTVFSQRVKHILQHLEGHSTEQRQIAPSAAVFFASVQLREDVLFWLDKATDEKAPQWRERVLRALIKHYAQRENFNEARRLLDEMNIQDEKDIAIATLAEYMAQQHPVVASFLLDDIIDLRVSSQAAQKLLCQPAIYSHAQGMYQLLLHLQASPEELATCLEAIIEKDDSGRASNALRKLFMDQTASGPSAAKLLQLCDHQAVGNFVKPRALEKFKIHLLQKSIQENTTAIPQFVSALQKHTLIDAEEANELLTLMKNGNENIM
jgi:Leucine-rich repeat (LRR) protein